MFFHEEENGTVAVLLAYEDEHPGETLTMSFAEGDEYRCVFLTAYEDDNDEDESDPSYDEFHTVVYDIVEELSPGPNATDGDSRTLCLNYRHMPVKVTADDGTVVYEKG